MIRGRLVHAAMIALLALAAGCGDDEVAPTRPPAPKGAATAEAPTASPPSVMEVDRAWWARRPAVRLFLTGGQLGLLKPCGCSSPQLGGLHRAAAVLHQLRRRAEPEHPGGPRTVLKSLALGWALRGSGEEQEEAKADYVRAVREALGYELSLLGATDVRVPALCQPRGTGVELPRPPLNVRLVAANPACATVPFADFGAGPFKVRAFSLVDPDHAERMRAEGAVDAVMSATQALARTPMPDTLWIAAIRAESAVFAGEVQTALTPLGPGVVVDLSGGVAGGARRLDDVRIAAGRDALVVELGELGKAVGVIDLDPAPDGEAGWVLSYRRIELVPQWEKYGGAPAESVAAIDGVYREMVRGGGYLEEFVRGADAGPTYVGSSACAGCHTAIYKDWRRSGHALALETLEQQNYHWDPECIRCHVVGWKRVGAQAWYVTESAFRTPDKTPYLGGVGCENCHGPGSAHVRDPWDLSLFAPGAANVTKPGQDDTCVPCHDAENSHGFLEGYAAEYLPRVDHRRVPTDLKTVVPDDWEPPGGGEPGPPNGK